MNRFLKYFYFFILCLKALECFTPFSHGDAFSYHLIIPKHIIELGFTDTLSKFFPTVIAGYFDLLYLIPLSLFKNTLAGQISSQLLHFLIGQGLASFLMTKIIKDNQLKWIAGIAALTLAKSGDMFLYAKNDGVVVSASLLFYYFSNKSILRKGVLLGLLPSIKLSGVFIALPLILNEIVFKKIKLIEILILGVTSILIFIPICLYKFKMTGNPLFPGLLYSFPDQLPQYLIDSYGGMLAAKLGMSSLIENLRLLFLGKIICLLIIPVLIFQKKKINTAPFIIAILCFSLYLFVNGAVPSPRFFFSSYFFLIIGCFGALDSSHLQKKWIVPVLLILVLVDSKLDKSLTRVKNNLVDLSNLSSKEIISKRIPRSRVWDLVQKGEKEKLVHVFSDRFPQQFYAPQFVRLHHYPTQPQVRFFDQCSNPSGLEKFQYYILSESGSKNPCYEMIYNSSELIGTVQEFKVFKRKPSQSLL